LIEKKTFCDSCKIEIPKSVSCNEIYGVKLRTYHYWDGVSEPYHDLCEECGKKIKKFLKKEMKMRLDL